MKYNIGTDFWCLTVSCFYHGNNVKVSGKSLYGLKAHFTRAFSFDSYDWWWDYYLLMLSFHLSSFVLSLYWGLISRRFWRPLWMFGFTDTVYSPALNVFSIQFIYIVPFHIKSCLMSLNKPQYNTFTIVQNVQVQGHDYLCMVLYHNRPETVMNIVK